MYLPRNPEMKRNSQELRKNSTKEERHLWYDFLRAHKCQFNRQKVIGGYIVDFFCKECSLAIELDGSQHYEDEAIAYDHERTAYLNGLGITVLRFTNNDVNSNFGEVCRAIDAELERRAGPE